MSVTYDGWSQLLGACYWCLKGLIVGFEGKLSKLVVEFKDFSSDIRLSRKKFSNSLSFIKTVFNLVFKYPYSFYVKSLKLQRVIGDLQGYDVVQLINEHAIGGLLAIEKIQLKRIKKTNGALFLPSCGDDFINISYYLSEFSKLFRYRCGNCRIRRFTSCYGP